MTAKQLETFEKKLAERGYTKYLGRVSFQREDYHWGQGFDYYKTNSGMTPSYQIFFLVYVVYGRSLHRGKSHIKRKTRKSRILQYPESLRVYTLCQTLNAPYTERYVRCGERTGVNHPLLLDRRACRRSVVKVHKGRSCRRTPKRLPRFTS